MKKRKILFVINQFFKGGAEMALVNFFRALPKERYEIDFMIFDQIELKTAISLIPTIPDWIHVINVTEREHKMARVKRAAYKVYRRLSGVQLFHHGVRRYLKGRSYDVAISYGEWFTSELVAKYASAKHKYVWIHADMDKASFVHPDILRYESFYDGFIFPSKHSMCAAKEKYPQLAGRSYVVFNQVDCERLTQLGQEPIRVDIPHDGLPWVLTVANIREEKNHLRQVEAMEKLFERGVRFHWLNVGSLAGTGLVSRVRKAVKTAGLEEYFHLLGAMDNPYALMCQAEAVCVLSDHESWSMVITEAKTLGVPVIATKTSGALEQLVDGENGVLCDFSAEAIADSMERFLTDSTLRTAIRKNLCDPAMRGNSLGALESLLQSHRKKILFAFDDVNYLSGARNAAFAQIRVLEECARVDIFSSLPCQDEVICQKYNVVTTSPNGHLGLLSKKAREVVRDPSVSLRGKFLRLAYAVLARLGQETLIPERMLTKEMGPVFEAYDAIVVVSEASKLRRFVSERKNPKKIQWIHTDYAAWRERSEWTRAITMRDGSVYKKFDHVVCLSERLRQRFLTCVPGLNDQTLVIPNLVESDKILALAMDEPMEQVDGSLFNLISIGRMEMEKRYDRLLAIAAELKERQFRFHWYFVGGGLMLEQTKQRCHELGLDEQVTFTGEIGNPYPLMSACDLFVLLSEYEGMPVTIDEAKVLALPILASDVGGVADQLESGKYGELMQRQTAQNNTYVIERLICKREKPQRGWDPSAQNAQVRRKLAALVDG